MFLLWCGGAMAAAPDCCLVCCSKASPHLYVFENFRIFIVKWVAIDSIHFFFSLWVEKALILVLALVFVALAFIVFVVVVEVIIIILLKSIFFFFFPFSVAFWASQRSISNLSQHHRSLKVIMLLFVMYFHFVMEYKKLLFMYIFSAQYNKVFVSQT